MSLKKILAVLLFFVVLPGLKPAQKNNLDILVT